MLDQMTPAPWEIDPYSDNETTAICGPGEDDHVCIFQHDESTARIEADAAGICLLRNALDVQVRRGWGTRQEFGNRWYVVADDGYALPGIPKEIVLQPDPVTALIEAEKWYIANKERHK